MVQFDGDALIVRPPVVDDLIPESEGFLLALVVRSMHALDIQTVDAL